MDAIGHSSDTNRRTAVAFGYFETLVHLGDGNKFLEEETRLRSLSNVLNAAGFEPMLYEDFADEMFGLLRKVASSVQDGSAEEVLLESFNDEMLQNYVITHLKVLTIIQLLRDRHN